MKQSFIHLFYFSVGFIFLSTCQTSKPKGPYFATGIKIGEVTQNEAIVWTRLTAKPKRSNSDSFPTIRYKDTETGQLIPRKGRPDMTPVVFYPENYTIKTIDGATPGKEGKVRIKYKAKEEHEWKLINWQAVNVEKNFTKQFKLQGLSAGKEYELIVEASLLHNNKVSASIEGKFKTATAPDIATDANFIVTTGTSYGDVDSEKGYKLYPNSLKLDPEFFIHTGDIVYYDGMGKTLELARWHWDRMYSYFNNIEYHRQVASYFVKDDHDTWMNDCYPGMKTKFMGEFTYDQGTQVFLDEVPIGEKTYRTVRWGQDLQIWLVEGRDYRSPNDMPDGPNKTIWGKEQWEWFIKTVEESNATYKILISPTPIVGPDRKNKNDNHANEGFQFEGNLVREFISKQNMVVVCGDRHWQYVSQDQETGVMEFSCGPGSNAHAGGWKQSNKLPEHIYLNVGGGFLEGTVSQIEGQPTLVFRHYDPDGKLLNEHTMQSK